METSSAVSTTPTSNNLRLETPPRPAESDHPSNSSTPMQQVENFDGTFVPVKAKTRYIHQRCLTKGCLGYFVHLSALLIMLIVGLTMALVNGWGSPAFGYWAGLFTFSVGNFIPSPKLADNNQPVLPQ